MALTPIESLRLLVGDTEASYFYPILTDEQYQYFLEYYNNNMRRAAVAAARSIAFTITSFPTREKTGEVERWNEYAKQYLALLKGVESGESEYYLYGAVMPYAAGISWADIRANENNCDNVIPKLAKVADDICCDPLIDTNFCCDVERFT